jgi:multidrug transporter EmrE-like cation transporter
MSTLSVSIAWIMLGSFVGSFGMVFLKIGAGHIRSLKSLLLNWRLAMGIALYLLSSVFFLKGINNGGELSVLYPMVSTGSIWTLLWSKLFLGETLTRPKFIAVGMILAGSGILILGSAG